MLAGQLISHVPPRGEELTLEELNKMIGTSAGFFVDPGFILKEIIKYVGDFPTRPLG